MIDAETGATSTEIVEGPGPKRARAADGSAPRSALVQQVEASGRLVEVKEELVATKDNLENSELLVRPMVDFGEVMKSKVAQLKKIALQSGADVRTVERICEARCVSDLPAE